ncbi:MAG: glycosyltransferase family 39 protein [Bryobacterales bacterium]|nr:glycosyltransferase family 39 protein [Bryobacteraceae bacterium]MDW8131744.1 glycosyltransferase family 39 protein [Bryobacterales bacterium]
MPRGLLLAVLFTLLLRLPFLDHAIQGDDIYYLAGAQHAQMDPLHPTHARYVFLGQVVEMQGHPHPPFNAWFLALLLALMGEIYEAPYHASYLVFSAIAAAAAWSLARRFSSQPLLATLLTLAAPAFLVNGNSLEADVPLMAFWLAATALFVRAVDEPSGWRLGAAVIAMALAALTAYQAVLLAPILAAYLWQRARAWRLGWLALATAPAVIAAWQLFERLTTGSLPAAILAGFFRTYGLQTLERKLANAAALTAHLGWLVFPLLALGAFGGGRTGWLIAGLAALGGAALDSHPLFWFPFAVGVLVLSCLVRLIARARDADQRFLALWAAGFFAAALVLFFAGSARYLLPMAAPVALLTARRLEAKPHWLWAGLACQVALGLALARVNYEHWEGYREFARTLAPECRTRRVWINGEWGLRFYLEAEGGLPLVRGQAVQPGEIVVSSRLAYPIRFTTGGGAPVVLAERTIRASLPLRLIGLGARSAWSSATFGLRPFDWRWDPLDAVRAELIVERTPELEYLPVNSPAAEHQIVSGLYELEEGRFRWMGGRAVVLLRSPVGAAPVEVRLFVPQHAPARRLRLQLDGLTVLEATLPGPGLHSILSRPVKPGGPTARLVIELDRTFRVPGDHRELGLIVVGLGFKR